MTALPKSTPITSKMAAHHMSSKSVTSIDQALKSALDGDTEENKNEPAEEPLKLRSSSNIAHR